MLEALALALSLAASTPSAPPSGDPAPPPAAVEETASSADARTTAAGWCTADLCDAGVAVAAKRWACRTRWLRGRSCRIDGLLGGESVGLGFAAAATDPGGDGLNAWAGFAVAGPFEDAGGGLSVGFYVAAAWK